MGQCRKKKIRRLAGLLLAGIVLAGMMSAAQAAPSVDGTGAIVVDFETNEVYYEKNADVARPIASMTKLMSLYLVFEEIAAGNLSLDGYVTASRYAAGISNDPDFSGVERLRTGEEYRVDDLIRLIVTESCNGSVIVLAEHIGGGDEGAFVQRMNDRAAQWGIQAHFSDACGFQDNGNAVTPRAMAYIAKRIIMDHPQILEYTSLPSTQFQGRTFHSTNTLLTSGSCEGIDGLKTGTTDGAGYCFTGTAQRDGRRIISVVMNTTSYSARMQESGMLLEYGFACRAQREEEWAKAIQEMEVKITAQAPLWTGGKADLNATLTGLEGELFGTLSWEVDGVRLESGSPRWLKEGERISLPITVSEGEKPVAVAVTLTAPDGSRMRWRTELARPRRICALWDGWCYTGRKNIRKGCLWTPANSALPRRVMSGVPGTPGG